MPLTFKFHESTPRELYEYKRADGQLYWHPRAESLIFFTMLLKHNITGEMTDDKLIEIARRIALINLFHTSAQYWEGNKGYRIQMADIIAYWGLETNAGHENKRTWDAYYNKCFINRADKHWLEALRSTERDVHIDRERT